MIRFAKQVRNEKRELEKLAHPPGSPFPLAVSQWMLWRSALTLIIHERIAKATCRLYGHDNLKPRSIHPHTITCRRCLHEEVIE